MAEPYVAVFDSPGERLSTVVMDKEDFALLCDELGKSDIFIANYGDKSSSVVDQLRKDGYIPLIKRRNMTQWLFEKYGLETDLLSIMVRGMGVIAARKILGIRENPN